MSPLPALLDDAARYIAGHLAFRRILEGTDPRGWELARRLAAAAEEAGCGRDTTMWVEAQLPRPADGRRFTEVPR